MQSLLPPPRRLDYLPGFLIHVECKQFPNGLRIIGNGIVALSDGIQEIVPDIAAESVEYSPAFIYGSIASAFTCVEWLYAYYHNYRYAPEIRVCST